MRDKDTKLLEEAFWKTREKGNKKFNPVELYRMIYDYAEAARVSDPNRRFLETLVNLFEDEYPNIHQSAFIWKDNNE